MTVAAIYCDNRWVYRDTISVHDRGFLLGDGLFETLRCVAGEPVDVAQHWARLSAGADYLMIPLPVGLSDVVRTIQELLTQNSELFQQSIIRITLTRGVGARGLDLPESVSPVLVISITRNTVNRKGSLSLLVDREFLLSVTPLSRYKTLNYLDRILAREHACRAGYDDALMLNTRGGVVGVTAANIFVLCEGEWLTPALSEGALPGVMRARVLARASECRVVCREVVLSEADVLNAEAMVVTNSVVGVQVVSRLNDKVYGENIELAGLL